MTTSNQAAAWLEGSSGDRIALGESCVFGRSSSCEVVIADPRASRRHAMIHRQGDEYFLVDLGSANGTRLNGRRLTQSARLVHGAIIELAGSTYVFSSPGMATDKVAGANVSTVNITLSEIRRFEGWLLIVDIIGSTQFVQRVDTEKSLSLTAGWLSQCRKIVEGRQGTVNKFLGDGLFAYWPDQPGLERQIQGAIEQLRTLQGESEVPFRLVVHFGTVFSGGAPSLGEESLSGRDVTFAFRMEALCSVLGETCLLSEPAAKRVGEALALKAVGSHSLEGFEQPFAFYTV